MKQFTVPLSVLELHVRSRSRRACGAPQAVAVYGVCGRRRWGAARRWSSGRPGWRAACARRWARTSGGPTTASGPAACCWTGPSTRRSSSASSRSGLRRRSARSTCCGCCTTSTCRTSSSAAWPRTSRRRPSPSCTPRMTKRRSRMGVHARWRTKMSTSRIRSRSRNRNRTGTGTMKTTRMTILSTSRKLNSPSELSISTGTRFAKAYLPLFYKP